MKETVILCGKEKDITKEPNYRKQFFKRMASIGRSPKKAINLMCFQCQCFNSLEAKQCNDEDCPLYVIQWNRKNIPVTSEAETESEEAIDEEPDEETETEQQ